MSTPMKSMETKYSGYRFRSRTEARWAVFFDEIYIKYEYEKEGFILQDGTPYLPDFYLPDLETWVEIKGFVPTNIEERKCLNLHKLTGKRVVLIHGLPDPNTAEFFTYDRFGESGYVPVRFLARYLNDIICDKQPQEKMPDGKWNAEITEEILGMGASQIDGRFGCKTRLEKAYESIGKLINCDSEYEGDEYAFGVAKSHRFGEVA